jgi:N-acetylmuramoyl-L-alanine amidase
MGTKQLTVGGLETTPEDGNTEHKLCVEIPVIVIQAGHVGRTKGATGATGHFFRGEDKKEKVTVTEQQVADFVATRAAALLRGVVPKGVAVKKFDADNVPNYKTEKLYYPIAVVSIHCNGASSAAASGYTFGFPPSHEKVTELRNSLAETYEMVQSTWWFGSRIPYEGKENYNGNLSSYYVWSKLPTKAPAVLFELGYLSNPTECEAIYRNMAFCAFTTALAVAKFVKANMADKFKDLASCQLPPAASPA